MLRDKWAGDFTLHTGSHFVQVPLGPAWTVCEPVRDGRNVGAENEASSMDVQDKINLYSPLRDYTSLFFDQVSGHILGDDNQTQR